MNPRVSIVMSVFNGEKYIRQAVESLLEQTFKDYEFLIVDDGSTDRTVEIIKSYNDSRIYLVSNEKNLGLAVSLNRAIDLARGEYIARMDADDISLPDRLLKQVGFMEMHQEVGVCGTWARLLFGGKLEGVVKFPTDFNSIRCKMLFENVLIHPSVLLRKNMLQKHEMYYDEQFSQSQDYDFWVRCSEHMSISNIPEVLILLRQHEDRISVHRGGHQIKSSLSIQVRQMGRLGICPNDMELKLHEAICLRRFTITPEFAVGVYKWLICLKSANKAVSYFPEPAFSRELAWRGFFMMLAGAISCLKTACSRIRGSRRDTSNGWK